MKIKDKIQQDFRGGKLGKVLRIANTLLAEACDLKEEAKTKSLCILLNFDAPTREQFLEISSLVLRAKANINTANIILNLLGSEIEIKSETGSNGHPVADTEEK